MSHVEPQQARTMNSPNWQVFKGPHKGWTWREFGSSGVLSHSGCGPRVYSWFGCGHMSGLHFMWWTRILL